MIFWATILWVKLVLFLALSACGSGYEVAANVPDAGAPEIGTHRDAGDASADAPAPMGGGDNCVFPGCPSTGGDLPHPRPM